MKRLRSSDDSDSHGEKGVSKDWGRRDEDLGLHRSLSYRSSYYKSENGRKDLSSSSSRYDRLEDDRDNLRSLRKRPDYDVNSYDRRKSYDRYKDGSDKGILSSSPRAGYGADRINRSESFLGADRINRSESFSVSRRDFPKGIRSERDRSRREGSVSSWRRFGGGKDAEGTRNDGDSVKGSRVTPDDVEKVRSSLGLRDGKSLPWSKDSGSEQSKGVEVKKSDDLPVENGNSSEMEEGELEPELEPVPVPEPVAEDQASARMDSNQEIDNEKHIENKVLENGIKSFLEEKEDLNKESVPEEKTENRPSETVQDVVEEVVQLRDCQHASIPETGGGGHVTETTTYNEGVKDEKCASQNNNCEEEASDGFAEKSVPSEEKRKEDKGIDLEVKEENIDLPELNKGVTEKNGASGVTLSLLTEEITQNFKNKGKSVAVSPSYGTDVEDGFRIQRESRSLLIGRDNDMEGPSTRGFELFLLDPVKKPEKVDQSSHNKPKEEKLGFEPLELSLSLPNVLLPIDSKNAVEIPGSPSHAKSVQSFPSSFQTNSDRFTASMSFSGSQQFTHNPSCSLTHNSLDNYDYEKSVGSRPIFQGVDWQNLSSKEHKNKEVPMYQRTLSNGNGFHQSQASQSVSNSQAVQLQHLPGAEGSSRISVGLDRQLSFSKQLSGAQWRHPDDFRAPSQSVGSHETGSEYEYIKEKNRVKREQNVAVFHRSSNQEEKVQLQMGGPDIAEPIIKMIVSEPLHMTARRFNEMTAQSISCLRESVRDIVLNPGKRWQLSALQKALQNRSDISLDMLLKSHRAQLEILVSLKTGLQEFLPRNYDISSSDLAEIFMNIRCRNLACRNLLPVDECDCKVCAQKSGFCSACMCLVCLKFDNASNTCSWVGCDLCLHWCHVDCGLRESYVRNGLSETGLQRTAEMQFHCVACNHPSEMFGFVKEVFQNFAKDWTAETLSKELEYVRRIFCASEDTTGKRLHEIIIQLLPRLANKAELQEVKNHIISFLTESDSFKSGNTAIVSGKELSTKNQGEGSNGVESSQEAAWLKSFFSGKANQLENPAGLLPSFDFDRNGKHTGNLDLQRSAQKEPVFDELESIVRIKQAEAKMFQTRADDARREAEGLKRIAIAKSEKIEEEYANRLKKLHLTETEEIRKQKLEELEALERVHQEYFRMKMRMEAEIKDLLLKMEATKRNLTM